MADVIQCPTCSKRFKLPERPPAVFTCTSCGTAMDLSGFQAAPAPVAEAASARPAASTRSGASGRSAASGRTGASGRAGARGGSSRGARSASGRSGRARRGADDRGEEEAPGRSHIEAQREANKKLLVGSFIGFVVVLGLFFVWWSGRDKPTAPTPGGPPSTANAGSGDGTTSTGTGEPAAAGAGAAPAGAPPASAGAGTGDPAGTAAPEAGMDGAAPPPTKPPSAGKVQIHAFDHHPDATGEEKQKVDALIQLAVFENAGRDSRDAANQLAELGVRAAPRLINVFNTVKTGEGFDTPQGRVKAGVADGILRKIDGYMERKRKFTQIKATSKPDYAEAIARAWTIWWDTEIYKKPERPWDPRADGAVEEEGGGAGGPPDDGK